MSKDKKDKIDDGGSVSPMYNLTLRDYFAARAMHGILAAFDDDTTTMAVQVARKCYEIADAMIAARKEAK